MSSAGRIVSTPSGDTLRNIVSYSIQARKQSVCFHLRLAPRNEYIYQYCTFVPPCGRRVLPRRDITGNKESSRSVVNTRV